MTSLTPRRLRRFSAWNCSMSPIKPTTVRDLPRLTYALPPTSRTSSTMASMSCGVASWAITTTMALSSYGTWVVVHEVSAVVAGVSGLAVLQDRCGLLVALKQVGLRLVHDGAL